MKKIFKNFLSFSYTNSYLLIGMYLLFFVVMLFYFKEHFELDSDLKALFKSSDHTVQQLEKLNNRVGSYSTAQIVAYSDDMQKNIDFLNDLKKAIEHSDKIRDIEFERDVSYLEDHALLYLSKDDLERTERNIKKRIADETEKRMSLDVIPEEKKSDLSKEIDEMLDNLHKSKAKYNITPYYTAQHGDYVEIKVRPSGNDTSIKEARDIIAFLENNVKELNPEKYGVQVEVGGYYKHKITEVETIQGDLFNSLLACILLLVFVTVIYYRSLWSVPIVFFPLAFGIISGIMTTQFIVGKFNLISAFSFAMLFGIGIENAIHIFSRYCEHKKDFKTPLETLTHVYSVISYPLLSSAATSILAFSTLILIQFKGFSDFGLVAGVGLTTSVFAIFVIMPAVIFSIERWFTLKLEPRPIHSVVSTYTFFIRHKWLLAVPIVFTIFSIVSLFTAKFEYDLDNLSFEHKYDPNTILNRYNDAVFDETGVSSTMPSFILTDSLEEAEDVTETLYRMKDEKDKNHYDKIIRTISSLYTFVPPDQEEKLQIIKRIKRLIERKINILPDEYKTKVTEEIMPLFSIEDIIVKERLPEWIKNKLKEKDGSWGKIVTAGISGNKSNVDDVLSIKKDYGVIHGKIKDYELIGSYMLLANIKNVIKKEVPLAVCLAFSTVFLILWIAFRSARRAIIVYLPFIVGMLWMAGVAYLTGIRFNLFNMIIVPTIVGIAIDSSVHIYDRFREEGIDKFEHAMKMTGGAVFLAGVTNFIGFFSDAFGSHKGVCSIGRLASIAIVMIMLSSLVFFPALITILAEKRKTHE